MYQKIQHAIETDAQKINKKLKGLNLQKRLLDLKNIWSCLRKEQLRVNNLIQEQGSPSFLTSLPLAEDEYDLKKQLLLDLIRILYGWSYTRLPDCCEYGEKCDFQHACSCKKGDLVSLRHNLVRNITSSHRMLEVSHDYSR